MVLDQDHPAVLNQEARPHPHLDLAVRETETTLYIKTYLQVATQSSNLEAVAQALDQASVSPKQYQIIWQEIQVC